VGQKEQKAVTLPWSLTLPLGISAKESEAHVWLRGMRPKQFRVILQFATVVFCGTRVPDRQQTKT
jgi:hypothetical protein